MNIAELIQDCRKQLLENSNDCTCLLFALQLPSICARIEFPPTPDNTDNDEEKRLYDKNGRPHDKKLYKTWLKKHKDRFFDIYSSIMSFDAFSNALYELRCKMTHEGILETNNTHFYFTEDASVMKFKNNIFLPMKRLCEDIFFAAEVTLLNTCNSNSKQFEDMLLTNNIYFKIKNDVTSLYESFWNNYALEDRMLVDIYNNVFLEDDCMEPKINKFFEKHPDGIFEEWDINHKFGYVVPGENKFIKQKYNEKESKISKQLKKCTDVLCLSKKDYERMLEMYQKLEDFSETHAFNINQYL